MSSVMSLTALKNSVKRNGFDLSFKNAFTAKVGELLPIMCKEVYPGDKFNIRGQAFTRTQPVNSAAYSRLREYYDFYFVPYRLLWNMAPTFFTNMPDPHHAASPLTSVSLDERHPWFTFFDLMEYLGNLDSLSGTYEKYKKNFFGFSRLELTCKLLNYLNYGIGKDYESIKVPGDADNILLSPFPILAYQKICEDYFRDDQWQSAAPYRYNLDYLYSMNNGYHIPIHSFTNDNFKNPTMFDLNYCNFQKDYFTGMLPKAQYGDVAFAPIDLANSQSYLTLGDGNSQDMGTAIAGFHTNGSTSSPQTYGIKATSSGGTGYKQMLLDLDSRLSVLALRQAECLQKWREIAQSGKMDYQTQIQKHFNVSPSETLSGHCKYLGGWTSNLDISEVVNTNLTGDNQADIQGKGTGTLNGNKVDFEAKEHGIIMCIYHCLPLLDWSINRIARQNFKTAFTDYAIPEFDSIGMQQLYASEMIFGLEDLPEDPTSINMGYVPRYADLKTSIDEIHGSFIDTLVSWVSPLTESYLSAYRQACKDAGFSDITMTYHFFKVNPHIVDNIFGVQADSTINTDQLLINLFFDIKAVRNFDYNGLPY